MSDLTPSAHPSTSPHTNTTYTYTEFTKVDQVYAYVRILTSKWQEFWNASVKKIVKISKNIQAIAACENEDRKKYLIGIKSNYFPGISDQLRIPVSICQSGLWSCLNEVAKLILQTLFCAPHFSSKVETNWKALMTKMDLLCN